MSSVEKGPDVLRVLSECLCVAFLLLLYFELAWGGGDPYLVAVSGLGCVLFGGFSLSLKLNGRLADD